ncbi:hypothetical protein Dimus_036117 [Dionaea muscipula]
MGSIFSVSIPVDAIITQCCSCIARQAGHVTELSDRRRVLRDTLRGLEAARNDVQSKVEAVEHGGRVKRLDQVQAWLSLADASITEAHALIEVGENSSRSSCFCGSTEARYKLGKEIAGKIDQLAALKSKGNFAVVGERLPVTPAAVRPSQPLVGVESLLENVLRCLEDEAVGVIGLYGMGGVGKTAILTKIHNELIASSSSSSAKGGFDYVIWVDVRRNQNLEELQERIGKKIGLEEQMQEASRGCQNDKYEHIARVLNGKKFVLLLDNLWEKLDLLNAGVPSPSNENGSKIVFTTRSEIVCGHMDAQKKIKLDCLEPEKAWELFRKKVGDDSNSIIDRDHEMAELARGVAKECGGLPLALITVGRTMASKKTPEEWSHSKETLRESASEFSGMDVEVLPLLAFSFENLPSHTLKACLLHFAFHPESAKITKRTLIDEWFRESLLSDHDRDADKRVNHGHDMVRTLVNMCLLEEVAEDERYVRLHDQVRDMLLWVASERGQEKEKYLVEAGLGLTKAPRVGKWDKARVVSLMNNQIKEIMEVPKCPHLEALYLESNPLGRLAPGFFSSMTRLRVLDLSDNKSLGELPSEICHLVTLESLNLEFTTIRRLPFELKKLVRLKVLDLTFTSKLTVIPLHVLSSLSALQSLRMAWCGSTDKITDDENNILAGGQELVMEEVRQLTNLSGVNLTLRSVGALNKFLSSENVMMYTKFLVIQFLKGLTLLDISYPELTSQLRGLSVSDCESLASWSCNHDTRGGVTPMPKPKYSTMKEILCFKKLVVVQILSCPNLKDLSAIAFAPKLEFLEIRLCKGLEKVIARVDDDDDDDRTKQETRASLLSELKELWLTDMPQLKCICNDEDLHFPQLKKVLIVDCPQLRSLSVHASRAEGPTIKLWGQEKWWRELQWENEATSNAFDPEFDVSKFFQD